MGADWICQDVRHAIRTLRKSAGFAAVAVLIISVGIGANTAMFSLVNSLVLRSLPVLDPQRLVLVSESSALRIAPWTYAIWDQTRQHEGLFERVSAFSEFRFDVSVRGETEFVQGMMASGSFFDTLGVRPMFGRTFNEADDVRGGGPDGPVAVIGHGFWQRRFAGAAQAIGSTLVLNRIPYTIIGITPPEFFGPVVGKSVEVFVPIGTEPLIRGRESFLDERSTWWLTIMARLKPGQSIEAAASGLRGVQRQIREATLPGWGPAQLQTYLSDPFTIVPAATGYSPLRLRYQRPIVTILVVVAVVLLIACANIANVQLARTTARRHELSLQRALGASQWRLARLLLVESLVLSALGAAGGFLLAQWGSRALVAELSTNVSPVFLNLTLDWRVMGFTIGVTLATTVLFGVVPACRAGRVAPIGALKEHGPTGAAKGRIASGLVVVQVALSLTLLVAAGLFGRTFTRLATLNLGFDAERVLIVNLNAQTAQIPPGNRLAVYLRVLDAVRTVPGVVDAGLAQITPVSGSTRNARVDVSGGAVLPERQRMTNVNAVTRGWFATYGTPILAGRDVADTDVATSPPVALVNEAFASKFLGGANPIGHVVTEPPFGPNPGPPPREIVGVVGDAVYRDLREPVPATVYIPLAQFDRGPNVIMPPTISVSVRAATGSPRLLARSVAGAISAVSPDLVQTFGTLKDQVDGSLTQERILARLSGFFGVFALLLAVLGLYGVTSYAVTRRRTEIGIRMALGAVPGGVVRMVLGQVTWLIGMGLIAGAVVSVWASQFVATLLYGLEPRDPAVIAGAAATLAAVGAIAGWVPAYRASRIDPAEVLRKS